MSYRLMLSTIFALTLFGNLPSARGANLVPFGATWRYLNPQTAAQDPNVVDPTFDANWFKPTFNLNGPNAWSGPSPEPFARAQAGTTDAAIEAFNPSDNDFIKPAATLIPLPATGERNTSYFRHNFTTTAPTSYLALEYLIDDGARIYLDGKEIGSVNCCTGVDPGTPPVYTSRATAAGNERDYNLVPVMIGQSLPAGQHTLAVSVHQNVASSNDMAFSARLIDGYVYDRFVARGDTFDYFLGWEEPSDGTLDWTNVGFQISNEWDTGPEGFGYDTDQATNALGFINTLLEDMYTSFSSLYLRKEFTVADPSKYGVMQLTMDYDDGFVAYINGQEVVRSFVQGNVGEPVPYDAFGDSHESTNSGTAAPPVFTIDLSAFPDLLNTGDNVLAIHGLNTTLDSSDFVLGKISLAGLAPLAPPGLPGDFDGNEVLDAGDIDSLSAAVRTGSTDTKFDVNSDGSVNQTDRTVWVETLKRTYFGDANMDGQFNSSDFVAVFTIGKYDSGQPAGWAEGDWNGDALFNSSDFVAAFTAGGYDAGPRASVSAVPEPTGGALLAISLAGLFAFRRRGVRND